MPHDFGVIMGPLLLALPINAAESGLRIINAPGPPKAEARRAIMDHPFLTWTTGRGITSPPSHANILKTHFPIAKGSRAAEASWDAESCSCANLPWPYKSSWIKIKSRFLCHRLQVHFLQFADLAVLGVEVLENAVGRHRQPTRAFLHTDTGEKPDEPTLDPTRHCYVPHPFPTLVREAFSAAFCFPAILISPSLCRTWELGWSLSAIPSWPAWRSSALQR